MWWVRTHDEGDVGLRLLADDDRLCLGEQRASQPASMPSLYKHLMCRLATREMWCRREGSLPGVGGDGVGVDALLGVGHKDARQHVPALIRQRQPRWQLVHAVHDALHQLAVEHPGLCRVLQVRTHYLRASQHT